MEKKDDASLAGSRSTILNPRTHPPYIEMVQKALMEHGGEEGLTAEEINKYLIAANYDLPGHHHRRFPIHLNRLTQRNAIIQDPSSGRYTIPGKAEVERLQSQVEEALCKLKQAEDQYIKNLAGPFVKEFHLSKIQKLIDALVAEASTSIGDGEFKKPTSTHGEFKKPTLTQGSHPNIARSLLATAGEISPDPGHGGPGPTAEQSGDERPNPIVNPAGNASVPDVGLQPRRGSPGCLSPMGKRPIPDMGPGSEAPGYASGSFKMPKNARALMEKNDSPPPSRFPGAGASPTDRSAGQLRPSSPSSPRRAAPSLQERLSSGEDDSPTNSEAPLKLRSLKEICADLDRRSLKFRIKVPPGYDIHSPITKKRSGAAGHGDPLKFRFKLPPGSDVRSLGAQPSDSSPGVQVTESAPPSLHYEEMVDNVLEDYLKQEIVNDDYKASLRAGIGGPVGSLPGPSGPTQPSRLTGPDEGPGRKAHGSSSGSFKIPKNSRALQSQEGRGGKDTPVVIGGAAGSRPGPGEPSQATPARSANKPGRWFERKLDCGTILRIKHPEPASRPSDKPNNRESENE